MRKPVELGVQTLHVEQAKLVVVVGVQRALPCSGPEGAVDPPSVMQGPRVGDLLAHQDTYGSAAAALGGDGVRQGSGRDR